ncbi:MAG TPA: hypothetical protein VHW01_25495, partial [Polyangiaceae bacterium]|nr:hypothetical protein [Polyangiaceae bacterium]
MSVPPTSATQVDPQNFRRVDRLRGLVVVGLTFVLCLLVSAWVRRRSLPQLSTPPAPASSAGVVGFPSSVDVVKNLALARQLTPRALLRGIVVENVKSDGTIDVTARGHVRYSFQGAEGDGPQPAREPGTLARRPTCGRQTVEIRKEGMRAETDAAEAACAPHPSDPLPDPHCTLAEIWAHAALRGVPTERAAHIEYYRATAGPAWRFEAPHVRGRFVLYG